MNAKANPTTTFLPFCIYNIDKQLYIYYDCRNLKEIECLAITPPTVGNNAFNKVNKEECELKVPEVAVEDYKAAKYWNEFLNIIGIIDPAGINSITTNAASGKTYGINGAVAGDGYKGIVIRNGKKILVK